MGNKFQALEPEEVISVEDSAKIVISHKTFKIGEFTKAMMSLIRNYDGVSNKSWTEEKGRWASEGVNGEVLKYGAKGWQKGKLRITVEFCPDEPEDEETPVSNTSEPSESESPLDDIRRLMKEDNI